MRATAGVLRSLVDGTDYILEAIDDESTRGSHQGSTIHGDTNSLCPSEYFVFDKPDRENQEDDSSEHHQAAAMNIAGNGVYDQGSSHMCFAFAGCTVQEWRTFHHHHHRAAADDTDSSVSDPTLLTMAHDVTVDDTDEHNDPLPPSLPSVTLRTTSLGSTTSRVPVDGAPPDNMPSTASASAATCPFGRASRVSRDCLSPFGLDKHHKSEHTLYMTPAATTTGIMADQRPRRSQVRLASGPRLRATKTGRKVTFSKEHIYGLRENKGVPGRTHGMSGKDLMRILSRYTCVSPQVYQEYLELNQQQTLSPTTSTVDMVRLRELTRLVRQPRQTTTTAASLATYARVQTVAGLKQSLWTNGPCVIVLPLVRPEVTQFWRGTFPRGTSETGHALTVVGYADDKAAFLLRNTWGAHWNKTGHVWYPYKLIETETTWEIWTLFLNPRRIDTSLLPQPPKTFAPSPTVHAMHTARETSVAPGAVVSGPIPRAASPPAPPSDTSSVFSSTPIGAAPDLTPFCSPFGYAASASRRGDESSWMPPSTGADTGNASTSASTRTGISHRQYIQRSNQQTLDHLLAQARSMPASSLPPPPPPPPPVPVGSISAMSHTSSPPVGGSASAAHPAAADEREVPTSGQVAHAHRVALCVRELAQPRYGVLPRPKPHTRLAGGSGRLPDASERRDVGEAATFVSSIPGLLPLRSLLQKFLLSAAQANPGNSSCFVT